MVVVATGAVLYSRSPELMSLVELKLCSLSPSPLQFSHSLVPGDVLSASTSLAILDYTRKLDLRAFHLSVSDRFHLA